MKRKPPKPTADTPAAEASVMWAELAVWHADRGIYFSRWAMALGAVALLLAVVGAVTS